MSPTVTGQVMTAILQAWFSKVRVYTPAQYYQVGYTTASFVPIDDWWDPVWGDNVYAMIPQFRAEGVNGTLLNSICEWAATVWPQGNWSSLEQ